MIARDRVVKAIDSLEVKTYKPLPHQYGMVHDAINNVYDRSVRGHAFFCEMGTGKTYSSILVQRVLKLKYVIVLCPKSAVYSWISDVEKHSWEKCFAVTGTAKQRIKALEQWAEEGGYAVINYEGLPHLEKRPDIYKLCQLAIADESHKIKSPKASRTAAAIQIFEDAPHKLILTGTPITNNVLDIFTQMYFLNPALLGSKNYYAFRGRYCKMGGFKNKKVVALRNEEELKFKLNRYSTELKKEDCLDLPDKLYTTRYVEMSTKMRKQYNDMKRDLVMEYELGEIEAPHAAIKAMRLHQISSGEFLSSQSDNNKLEALLDAIEEITSQGKQVLVWYHFKASARILRETIKAKGYTTSEIGGDTNDREDQVAKFKRSESQVFILSKKAASVSLTLNESHYALYYENNFTMDDRKQSEDRTHRIGQDHICQYIDFVYRSSLDEQVLKALSNKQDMATHLIDSFRKGEYLEAIG